MRISIGKAASTWLTVTLIGCSMLFETSTGWAQQKGPSLREQLMGTWTFVSASETRKDGTKMDRWGANPKGSLMFDAGRYIFVIMRSDLPKFATNSALEGTAEEDKAVGSSFPNLVGTDQKRIITSLTADELKYHNPVSSTGADAQVVWKRAK